MCETIPRTYQNSTSPYTLTKDIPTRNVPMMQSMIHTEELIGVQYWKSTQMAEISAGIENQFP